MITALYTDTTMADPPRKFPHDVQTVHPAYAPPKEKPMPASLDDILRAQQDTIAELRKKEKREEAAAAAAVTKGDLQTLGSTVVQAIKKLSDEVDERFDAVDERFDGVDQQVKGVQARVTVLETASPVHRARVPVSIPPRSPAELGLKATDTGSRWIVDDAGEWVRKWTEQEAMRKGAEEALEEVRIEAERQKAAAEKEAEKKQAAFDRKLKNWSIGVGLAALVFGGAVSTVTYLFTHVSIHPATTQRP